MKYVVLGDLHFGIKGFNDEFFTNQLKFFNEQLFPYMKENNIDTIIQLGDWLDNRKSMDIKFFNRIVNEFCEPIKEYGFKFITFLGNHDIYYNSRLDINLVKYFQKLFPENIEVIENREKRMFGNQRYMFMPWVIDKPITRKELEDVDLLFGHFEIKNFEMVKGHVDENSQLESNWFKQSKRLKRVISGHYHVQGSDGFVMYAGTPYQLNWGDHDTERGFFVFENTKYTFIENIKSQKYIKLKYNDSDLSKLLEVKGHIIGESEYFSSIDGIIDILFDNKVKFFINEAKDKNYESLIYELHQNGIPIDVINNVEISELIGMDFVSDMGTSTPLEIIINRVTEKDKTLLPLLDEIMSEIKDEQ